MQSSRAGKPGNDLGEREVQRTCFRNGDQSGHSRKSKEVRKKSRSSSYLFLAEFEWGSQGLFLELCCADREINEVTPWGEAAFRTGSSPSARAGYASRFNRSQEGLFWLFKSPKRRTTTPGQTHLNFPRTKITTLAHFDEFGDPIQRHPDLKLCRKHPFQGKSASLEDVFEWSSATNQFVNELRGGKRI
jgi:hypothetical protein